MEEWLSYVKPRENTLTSYYVKVTVVILLNKKCPAASGANVFAVVGDLNCI